MIGKTFETQTVVDESNTALAAESGNLRVFATPMMIALMEKAAACCIADDLDEGFTSVGTAISVSHVAATPVGMRVTAKAEVTQIDARRYDFRVEAFDEKGLIGEGTHSRVAVYRERFMAKTLEKQQ